MIPVYIAFSNGCTDGRVVWINVTDKVFVYGTLQQENTNYSLLQESTCLGRGTLHDLALYDVNPWYPGAVRCPGKKVLGEVYEVSPAVLSQLDLLENNGVLYQREMMPVVLEPSGEKVEAWVYLWLGNVTEKKEVPLHRQPWKG